ncbi:fumarylacetoacetase [Cladophialophora immunda]|uniref:Fumarylacetoacetase n=1 Tax=Cladophialophora immunda TaxID=569365 RepID=A0A0D2D5S5_9EURO|nr:fumarylacetoacetase [Cladophialophora immunda]KIW30999.1 fumarylacetoacetase [Cladophialophora immunda]
MLVTYPIHVEVGSPFPIENIPFGVFSTIEKPVARIGTIIGDFILDLSVLASRGIFTSPKGNGAAKSSSCRDTGSVFFEQTLNAFAAQGRAFHSSIRMQIIHLLSNPNSILFTDDALNGLAFLLARNATMHLPMHIHGFADFLCSEVHATNCARIAGQSLHPSFYGFPTAYNGRASSIVPSGTPVKRPRGMLKGPPAAAPILNGTKDNTGYRLGPTARLDFELEIGVFISKPVPYGRDDVTADEAAEEHIFGFVLLNDWSARDVQFAEMVPLGPFNGKATATTISPWVIMPDALENVACGSSVERAREEMDLWPRHLQHSAASFEKSTFDVELEVAVIGKDGVRDVVCESNLRHLYWSPAQMVAHQASSGCGLKEGDLIGTGTISGPNHSDQTPRLGCLFELTEGGRRSVSLKSGRKLTWLEDGDEVVFTGWARAAGRSIGFGEARGLVMPAAL